MLSENYKATVNQVNKTTTGLFTANTLNVKSNQAVAAQTPYGQVAQVQQTKMQGAHFAPAAMRTQAPQPTMSMNAGQTSSSTNFFGFNSAAPVVSNSQAQMQNGAYNNMKL